MIYLKIAMKNEYGICPVCNGTKREAVGERKRIYITTYRGYDSSTDTLTCTNCGGKSMYGEATGMSKIRPDGTPCKHQYKEELISKCYYKNTCIHCGDIYYIDSGD